MPRTRARCASEIARRSAKSLPTGRVASMPIFVTVKVSGSEVGSRIAPLQPGMNTMSCSARTRVEEVVAPGDRPAQRLLPFRQVPRAGGQERKVPLEAIHDLLRGEQLDPRRGELDGEGHAVQSGGDPRNGRGIAIG